jgi:hypothetical protein
MTEEEWLSCADWKEMGRHLRQQGYHGSQTFDRKWRLLGCAICRLFWDRIPHDRNRAAITVIERHPAGSFDDFELHDALCSSSSVEYDFADLDTYWAIKNLGRSYYKIQPESAFVHAAIVADRECGGQGKEPRVPLLFREVFGNPFRKVTITHVLLQWNLGTVPRLAQTIYDEDRWADILILSDALEDAGCDNVDILNHLRGPGPHVRGCWALDILLGKE